MPFHYSMLFQMNTVPEVGSLASTRTAGWSEGHWRQTQVPVSGPEFTTLRTKRALLLPRTAAIVGYRVAEYEFQGNKMIPKGASSGKARFPGGQLATDVPQMSLELSASTNAANSTRFAIRCIPDVYVAGGEYAPDAPFQGKVTQFRNALMDDDWAMVGKDFTQTAYGIVSISTTGLMTVKPGAPFTAEVDSVRLRGVRDINGIPISGSFDLGVSPATNQFILLGWPQGKSVLNVGTVRRDIVFLFNLVNVEVNQVVSRKVGAPFGKFRGKASRRRVA